MISYPIYKFLHLIGLMLLMYSIGGLEAGGEERRKRYTIINGVALFFMILAGFGMTARLGIAASQWWVVCKISVWVLVGAWPALLKRKPELGRKLSPLLLLLAAGAAYLGVFGKTLG